MEERLLPLLIEYGYIILFIWCLLEGELGLIMAGILCHTGDLSVPLAIFIGGLGGFLGDQFYFYLGRYNKRKIQKKLEKERRKFAIAHLLLKKYGWPIIFIQRYLYGLRAIIPLSIGITRYPSRKFLLINLFSAWCWAAITIVPAYVMGDRILIFLNYLIEHSYIAIPVVVLLIITIFLIFKKIENSIQTKKPRQVIHK